MRICLFGHGPLCAAVVPVLTAHGHILFGPFATPQPTEVLRATQASVGLSLGYRHKLTPEDWGCFPDGILNLHTGYLPWNRGAYPNVWPILDGSPAGVTLHRVDAGWDTGPILAQIRVDVEPVDTAKTLYDNLIVQGVALVVGQVYKADSFGWADGVPQLAGEGSFHRKKDLSLVSLGAVDGMSWPPIRDLLRAFSFSPFGFDYTENGKLIRATITLTEVTE